MPKTRIIFKYDSECYLPGFIKVEPYEENWNRAYFTTRSTFFIKNINLFIYKQYINFLYKLNCFVVDQKCCSCPLSKECYYYHCTGENFKYYPNILIETLFFTQAIFQKEEVLKISFFIIGEDIKHMNYINLFFQSYLNQKIQGYFFYLKNINMIDCNQKNISLNHIMISSCIKTTHFYWWI